MTIDMLLESDYMSVDVLALQTAAKRMRSMLSQAQAALKDCSEDLRAEINARYPAAQRKYPSIAMKHWLDMATVECAEVVISEIEDLLTQPTSPPQAEQS